MAYMVVASIVMAYMYIVMAFLGFYDSPYIVMACMYTVMAYMHIVMAFLGFYDSPYIVMASMVCGLYIYGIQSNGLYSPTPLGVHE